MHRVAGFLRASVERLTSSVWFRRSLINRDIEVIANKLLCSVGSRESGRELLIVACQLPACLLIDAVSVSQCVVIAANKPQTDRRRRNWIRLN